MSKTAEEIYKGIESVIDWEKYTELFSKANNNTYHSIDDIKDIFKLDLEHLIESVASEHTSQQLAEKEKEVEGLKNELSGNDLSIGSAFGTIEAQSKRIKELEEVVDDLIKWEETNFIKEDLLVRLKSLLTNKEDTISEKRSG